VSETLRPENAAQLRDAIAWAVAEEVRLEIVARGTKRGFGRPLQTARTLDVSAFSGIRDYEPAELVMTAAAATPMAEIEAAVAAKNQMLAFEPPDLSALYGTPGGTLAGAIACNLAGPRRIKSGAARDHLLGFSGVSGRGEIFKAGGRVVKNVTGYDLCKLMAGSFGTLAVMDEVSIKVLPAAPKSRTVLVFGLEDREAVAAMATALNSPYDVSGAAHLPALLPGCSTIDFVRKAGGAVTAIRVEGTAASVAARCQGLRALLAGKHLEELHTMRSALLWREIRDVAIFLPDRAAAIWRVSVAPSDGPRIAASLPAGTQYFYDWGGGLLWIAGPASNDGGAASLRAVIAGKGHATLMRAPDPLRAAIPIFEPQPGPLAALSARVKDSFDPRRILNPGRMYAGV
jgi:glycolate oxidase FAD binding subunit